MIVISSFFKKQFDVSKAQLIGEGNFAQVFRVFDAQTQNYLAIRRVDRDLGQSQDIEKQKTINEELRRVQNENILKIFDIIQSETCIWYITEYCEGGSLWDALNNCQDNKMNQKDALQIVHQISKGVKQLHNHRITHRDLKPENILLKTKYIPNKPIPVIKIADFGLSTKKIIMETIAGTKQYIAPEQARFHNYTNAVDVWSLGIIFDEVLHGSPFYVGDNNKEVFQKILKNPYKVRDQTIRLSIQQFLMSVLKKKAYQRPIIAVICQSIERILDQIKKEAQQKTQSNPKLLSFEKKSVRNIPIQSKHSASIQLEIARETPKQLSRQKIFETPKQSKQVAKQLSRQVSRQMTLQIPNTSLRQLSQLENKKGDANSLSSTKRQQRKAKTPFKRQNGRPQLFKSTQEIEQEASTQLTYPKNNRIALASSKKQIQSKIINRQLNRQPPSPLIRETREQQQRQQKQQRQFKQQKLPKEQSQKQDQLENEKINVYRVDKRKIQSLPSKNQQLSSNNIDVRDYMESVLKIKNDLLQNSIKIGRQREFILNAQLTVSQFPEKFEGEEVLQQFRKNYDFLNYLNYNEDYQIKLLNGKNNLADQKISAQNQMLKHKEKIKKGFLSQMDKYVDYYVQKTIK